MIFLALALLFCGCQSVDYRGEHPKSSDLAGTYYRVKPGDSLDQIAKKYRVSKAEIMDINGVHELKPGMNLYVPEPDLINLKLADLPGKKPNLTGTDHNFLWPVKGEVVREFSSTKNDPFDGIAIKAPLGTKVVAALEGRVIFAGDDGTKFGLLVIMEHQGYITVYAQLSKALVKDGQYLASGEALGFVGRSGSALFPHLHFQVRVNQVPKDPRKYLRS